MDIVCFILCLSGLNLNHAQLKIIFFDWLRIHKNETHLRDSVFK